MVNATGKTDNAKEKTVNATKYDHVLFYVLSIFLNSIYAFIIMDNRNIDGAQDTMRLDRGRPHTIWINVLMVIVATCACSFGLIDELNYAVSFREVPRFGFWCLCLCSFVKWLSWWTTISTALFAGGYLRFYTFLCLYFFSKILEFLVIHDCTAILNQKETDEKDNEAGGRRAANLLTV
jgi:hypothetical protein